MKDNFLKSLTKNNLNNNLEQVLGNKNFSEETKNILLSIFYKIENGYDDYKTVKRNTYEKKEYIQKLIKIIDKDCDKISFLKNKDKSKEVVSRENKEIVCYPVETGILYSIAKIQKKNVVVKCFDDSLEKAFSFILNTGNNINIVEPLRDFNGFSWNVSAREIEDINCNLIYQNIIFLVGNKFVDKWVNSYNSLIDYFEIFQTKIEEQYGKKMKQDIISDIMKLSIMIYSKYNDEFRNEVTKKKEEIESLYFDMQDTESYLSKISKQKKQKEKEIRTLDKILNDKELLIDEYEKRNEKLPLEKKIFSVRVLKNTLKEERKQLLLEIDEYNSLMKPREFAKKRDAINQKFEILLCIEHNTEDTLFETIIHLQKNILKCLNKKIKNASDKQELLELLYQYRYYNYSPITVKKAIKDEQKLQKYLEKVGKEIIQKSIDIKLILEITEDTKLNYKIINDIVLSKIISLEDIGIKITNNKENTILTIFDEDIEDAEMKVEKKGLKIRFNKKIKFINV